MLASSWIFLRIIGFDVCGFGARPEVPDSSGNRNRDSSEYSEFTVGGGPSLAHVAGELSKIRRFVSIPSVTVVATIVVIVVIILGFVEIWRQGFDKCFIDCDALIFLLERSVFFQDSVCQFDRIIPWNVQVFDLTCFNVDKSKGRKAFDVCMGAEEFIVMIISHFDFQ